MYQDRHWFSMGSSLAVGILQRNPTCSVTWRERVIVLFSLFTPASVRVCCLASFILQITIFSLNDSDLSLYISTFPILLSALYSLWNKTSPTTCWPQLKQGSPFLIYLAIMCSSGVNGQDVILYQRK